MPGIYMNNKSCQILLVDNEKNSASTIACGLRDEGYEVLTAYDGLHALATAARHRFDLIIMDVFMPGVDGFWVCQELRRENTYANVPILFLMGRSAVTDQVKRLSKGGDDYLVRPFEMEELKAHAQILLRRSQQAAEETERSKRQSSTLEAGPLALSPATREARVGNTAVKLTPKEFDLLHHLMLHFGEILSSRELLQHVWGYPAESSCTSLVRWHIKCLREKIEPDPNHPIYIRTVAHHGYILDSELL